MDSLTAIKITNKDRNKHFLEILKNVLNAYEMSNLTRLTYYGDDDRDATSAIIELYGNYRYVLKCEGSGPYYKWSLSKSVLDLCAGYKDELVDTYYKDICRYFEYMQFRVKTESKEPIINKEELEAYINGIEDLLC